MPDIPQVSNLGGTITGAAIPHTPSHPSDQAETNMAMHILHWLHKAPGYTPSNRN